MKRCETKHSAVNRDTVLAGSAREGVIRASQFCCANTVPVTTKHVSREGLGESVIYHEVVTSLAEIGLLHRSARVEIDR